MPPQTPPGVFEAKKGKDVSLIGFSFDALLCWMRVRQVAPRT